MSNSSESTMRVRRGRPGVPFIVLEAKGGPVGTGIVREIVAELDASAAGGTDGRPRAASPSIWAEVRPDQQAEARERLGFLVMRGKHPDDALRESLDSMRLDEEETEADGDCDCDWTVIRCLAWAHPQPAREPKTYRPFHNILMLATTVTRLVDAELSAPGAAENIREYFLAFDLTDSMADACVEAFKGRYHERRRALGLVHAPAPVDDARECEHDGPDIPDDDEEPPYQPNGLKFDLQDFM